MSITDDILGKIDYLPPLPVSVTKVFQMLKDPKVTVDNIAEVIKLDPAIATSILRLCNSSYFSLNRKVTNIREAVVYVGLSQLKKIMVLSGTRQYFEKRKPGYEKKEGELWMHVLATSIIAEKLNELFKSVNKDDVYISALLHDIGKVVLSEFVMDASKEILSMVEQKGVSFLEAEKSVLGINHAEVGAKVLELWGFSEDVISAVKNHHMLFKEDDSELDNIIQVSNSLAVTMDYGTGVDGVAYYNISDICRLYNIKQNTLEKIMEESLEKIKQIEAEYGFAK
ncbi:HDOD domain-containing protein [Candidatus Latescibacterota bacterium]